MHYPPITTENTRNEFTDILEKYNVKKCIYGHLHGKAHANAIEGIHNGVEYIMTSCDYPATIYSGSLPARGTSDTCSNKKTEKIQKKLAICGICGIID